VSDLVAIIRIPRSSYYYHVKQKTKPDKYEKIKEQLLNIYESNHGRYGYRRITAALRHEGIVINHKTVQRLMKQLGLFCAVRMKKYNSYRRLCSDYIAPDLLKRDFKALQPNEKWVTDVTEIQLYGQKLYFSPILDLYNREIISYRISHRPKLNMVTDMLADAFSKIPDGSGMVLHSDQGWHYRTPTYIAMLQEKGIRQSMSRKGNCLDNAVMENFFGCMKSELLYLKQFPSVEAFIKELHAYIDYYNHQRIKSLLRDLSPVEYRLKHSAEASAA